MKNFQKTVLIIAVIILVVVLIFIGVSLKYMAHNLKWPPMIPECPDYWVMNGSGNSTTCINTKNLGICPPQSGKPHLTMNFNDAPFVGSNGLCNKYNWATKCDISWDGITYGVNNPCQS